jgi:hypothetical protein
MVVVILPTFTHSEKNCVFHFLPLEIGLLNSCSLDLMVLANEKSVIELQTITIGMLILMLHMLRERPSLVDQIGFACTTK